MNGPERSAAIDARLIVVAAELLFSTLFDCAFALLTGE